MNNKLLTTAANVITILTFVLLLVTNYLVHESNKYNAKMSAVISFAQEQINTLDELSALIIRLEVLALDFKTYNKDVRLDVKECLLSIANKAQKIYALSTPKLKPYAYNIYENSINITENSIQNIKNSFNELCKLFNENYFVQ